VCNRECGICGTAGAGLKIVVTLAAWAIESALSTVCRGTSS
jgi:hypothetical protein